MAVLIGSGLQIVALDMYQDNMNSREPYIKRVYASHAQVSWYDLAEWLACEAPCFAARRRRFSGSCRRKHEKENEEAQKSPRTETETRVASSRNTC